jgi:heme exporter protein A
MEFLCAQNLTCARGERTLFKDLSFQVNAGELLYVRGSNGAGKTSLLRLLVGLAKPVAGEITWKGVLAEKCPEEFRRDTLYLGHHGALKGELSALENLKFSAAMDGLELKESEALSALAVFGLKGRERLPVEWLSAGQKRRVLLARLALRKAKLWILDEPLNALDVNATEFLLSMIRDHLQQQGAVIMTSHQLFDLPNMKELVL